MSANGTRPRTMDMTLANVLRTLRAEQRVSQLELAFAMGGSTAKYLSQLENGHRTNPGRRFLARYVGAFEALGKPLSAEQRAALSDTTFVTRAA